MAACRRFASTTATWSTGWRSRCSSARATPSSFRSLNEVATTKYEVGSTKYEVRLMKTTTCIAAVLALSVAATASAQEKLGMATPAAALRPGWVFTPSMGVQETYDTNVNLGGALADQGNEDYVSSISPRASLSYYGRRTRFGGDYGASFLDYRTFSTFNRWDQSGSAELRRRETANLEWFLHGTAAAV